MIRDLIRLLITGVRVVTLRIINAVPPPDGIANSLTPHDYCDACGTARVRVRFTRRLSILDLCAHHYHTHQAAMREQGWRVHHIAPEEEQS